MKNKITLLLILCAIFTFHIAHAQSWSLYGNNTSSSYSVGLGTNNYRPLHFKTNRARRMTITPTGLVGIGTTSPNAKQEIQYYQNASNPTNGLMVTLDGGNLTSPADHNPSTGGLVGPNGESSTPSVGQVDFFTGHETKSSTQTFSKSQAPLLWLRKQGYKQSGWWYTTIYDTKFVVMPDGNCGINVVRPRVALDVRGSQLANVPTAILGSKASGTTSTNSSGLTQYYTQHVQFVPTLTNNAYNPIVQQNDQGMFFSDGKGNGGSNASGTFVIAPWTSRNPTVGGLRMDAQGNVEIHGRLRTTELKINAKWWSDFVFEEDYSLMSLEKVQDYISKYKHLPHVPSEAEILEQGLNVADMQAIQQQKIEELTLYIIQLKKEMIEMKKELAQVKKQ